MAEKLQIVDLQTLSPEHWNNHAPSDDCAWIRKPLHEIVPAYNNALIPFAEDILTDLLCANQDESPKPISTLKQGDTFDGTRLPEGTIIKYHREELKLGRRTWKDPYINYDVWGVVCSQIDNEGEMKKVIIPFVFFERHGALHQIATEDPVLTVGQTRHKRFEDKDNHDSTVESLVKVTSLEVHRIP